jgi:hypothetical protein
MPDVEMAVGLLTTNPSAFKYEIDPIDEFASRTLAEVKFAVFGKQTAAGTFDKEILGVVFTTS